MEIYPFDIYRILYSIKAAEVFHVVFFKLIFSNFVHGTVSLRYRISCLWLHISAQTFLVWDFEIRDDQPVLQPKSCSLAGW